VRKGCKPAQYSPVLLHHEFKIQSDIVKMVFGYLEPLPDASVEDFVGTVPLLYSAGTRQRVAIIISMARLVHYTHSLPDSG
jgi:hypothetical protein